MSSVGDEVPRKVEAELAPVALRLERLRRRLEADRTVDASVVDDVAGALADVRDAQVRLAENAAYVEDLIAAERARNYELFDRAPDAYLVTDVSGRIVEANGAAAALLGRTPQRLHGEPLPLFVAEDDRRRFRRILLELARSQTLGAVELRLESPTGLRDVEFRGVVEHHALTSTPLARWILRDVTARRTAEVQIRALNAELEERIAARTRELSDSYARLETVLKELPEGVLIVDAGGELELANTRAHELLGQSFEEIAAGIRDATWTLGDVPVRDGLAAAAERRESPLNGRFRYRRPDGEELILDAAATPVRGATGVTSVVLTFQDVTARERRERAERAFVTNAAHELQTPIAAIASAVEVLQSGAKRRAVDRDRFLDHVERSCRRLERLTRALLVLARAQTRAEEPRRELIPVAPLLEAVAEGLVGDGSIEVRCDETLAVVANRPLLEQALENLGANALKHTRGPVTLAGERRNGRVVICVRDSGKGIPVAERDRIFERFYRTDGAGGEGFGLGLAIVSEAVAALEGELELDTSPKGTSISIALPAATIVSA